MKRIISFLILFLSLFIPFITFSNSATKPESPTQQPATDEMISAMLMFGFRGYMPDQKFLNIVKEGKIGNFLLFDKDVSSGKERNIKSPEQVKELCTLLSDNMKNPGFIGIDQEGGQVRRLKPQKGFFDLPSAQKLGQGNAGITYETADTLGKELNNLGINLDLAPVVDVDSNPYNPVIGKLGRAFNTDPGQVVQHALAFGRGLAKNGVVPVLKHFPGQGCASKDSHAEPVDISQCWNPEVDLLPYAEIIQAGWPGMIMIGHLDLKELDKDLPASLSKNIVTGLLRQGLHWDGVVITDDLQMGAVASQRSIKEIIELAVNAGVDILMFGNNLEWNEKLPGQVQEAFKALVDEGKITRERLLLSWNRISALHAAYKPDTTTKNASEETK